MLIDRRKFLKTGLAIGAIGTSSFAPAQNTSPLAIVKNTIPSTGEELPAIGIGTNKFGTGETPEIRSSLAEVLEIFTSHGGTLLDSSSHYRGSEVVLGGLLADLKLLDQVFMATKAGRFDDGSLDSKMTNSLERLGRDQLELYMIHNAADQDWQAMLPRLREWQQEGKIKYIGVTTSELVEHEEIATIMNSEKIDFVQLNYNLGDRSVESTLLPLAKEKGIGVIGNVPFGQGALFSKVSGLELPSFAQEFCQSWGNFFLKYIVSHPDVIATIPGTTKPHHALDNIQAGLGRLPTAPERKLQEEFIERL